MGLRQCALTGEEDAASVAEIAKALDETLIRAIDTVDNDLASPAATDLARVVDDLNTSWRDVHSQTKEVQGFKWAAKIVGGALQPG